MERLTAALADRYRIERELGAGGMATVYLAEDLKHHRKVAVKVLRADLAASLGVERFLREVSIAARLSHPHILGLHDSGQADGFLYYVMPYVEGVSLRDRLAHQGELPISDAVRILTEVVEALAYAHRQGIVHRDLKPENIMLSGRHPLVMDFGVAKALSEGQGTGRSGLTSAGVALGTPAYMAPEQAAADPHVDHRVDLYALGVMGYELLTGQPPFAGMSAQQTMAAQVTESPIPLSSRRPTVPPVLEAILMQCLQKRPADRPQTAEEILQVLEGLATPSGGVTPTAARLVFTATKARPRRWQFVGAGVGVVAAVAIGVILWRRPGAPGPTSVARHTQLTYTSTAGYGEISPDGQWLAYLETGDSGRVVVKDLASGSVLPLAAPFPVSFRWSPDGSSLLVSGMLSNGAAGTALFPRLGGAPRPLPTGGGGFVGLSPDGTQLAEWCCDKFTLTDLRTNRTRTISLPPHLGQVREGDWSPDGRWVAVLTVAGSWPRQARSLLLGSVAEGATGPWHVLLSDTVALSPPRWSPTGEALYYLRRGAEGGADLWKLQIGSNGAPLAAPLMLQAGLGVAFASTSNNAFTTLPGISLTADGTKLVYAKLEAHADLWRATRSRTQREFVRTRLTRGTAGKSDAHLSPDGRLIAFVQFEHGKGDVFVLPLEGGPPRRVTSSGVAYGPPVWAPDGRSLAFVAQVEGKLKIRIVALDGLSERTFGGTEAALLPGELAWAPQERILYRRAGTFAFHWLDPATETEKPLGIPTGHFLYYMPGPSPDGQFVAMGELGGKAGGVYLVSLRDSSQHKQVTRDRQYQPIGWCRDGQCVYILSDKSLEIRRVPLAGGKGPVVATLPFSDPPASCNLSERGSDLVLLCVRGEFSADVWMLEDFDPTVHSRSTATPRTP